MKGAIKGAQPRARGGRRREILLAWIMLAPALVVVLGLIAFPVLYNAWLSFHSGGLARKSVYVGLENYVYTLTDLYFLPSLKVTLFYSLASAALVTLAGLAVALLLAKPFAGRRWIRALTLFPYVAPVVALAFVWRLIFDTGFSHLANSTLLRAGLISQPVAWLSEESTAIWMVIAFQVWRYFPFAMLLVLARLQAIPKELFEAAQVDGAAAWDRLRHIILPELKHVLGIVFVLRFVWTFNKFDDVFLLTRGDGGTSVLPILIRDYISGGAMGAAAACSVMLTVGLLAVVIFYQRRLSRWSDA